MIGTTSPSPSHLAQRTESMPAAPTSAVKTDPKSGMQISVEEKIKARRITIHGLHRFVLGEELIFALAAGLVNDKIDEDVFYNTLDLMVRTNNRKPIEEGHITLDDLIRICKIDPAIARQLPLAFTHHLFWAIAGILNKVITAEDYSHLKMKGDYYRLHFEGKDDTYLPVNIAASEAFLQCYARRPSSFSVKDECSQLEKTYSGARHYWLGLLSAHHGTNGADIIGQHDKHRVDHKARLQECFRIVRPNASITENNEDDIRDTFHFDRKTIPTNEFDYGDWISTRDFTPGNIAIPDKSACVIA